jgi:hypothetical protein
MNLGEPHQLEYRRVLASLIRVINGFDLFAHLCVLLHQLFA